MSTITLRRPFAAPLSQNRTLVGASTGATYAINQFGEATVNTLDEPALLAHGWSPLAGGASHPTSGLTAVDFGSFPGSDFASTTLSAVDADNPNALLFAYVSPTATVDHTADEHLVDPPIVNAINNGDGTITINAIPGGRDMIVQPGVATGKVNTSQMPLGQAQLMPVGKFSVGYAFLQ